MKKGITALLAVLCCFLPIRAGAQEPTVGYLPSRKTENGVVWAPVSALADALGENTVTATAGEEWLTAGAWEYYIPGGPRERAGELYVPAETYLRAAGYRVYFGAEGTMLLWRAERPRWSEDALYWLSRLVWAEARGESFALQLAVAEVVLNRVESGMYPNTVEGVIFDTENGVQFSPVLDGSIYNDGDASCLHAARIALSGSRTVPDETLFFVTDDLWDSWVGRNREFLFAMDNVLFFA